MNGARRLLISAADDPENAQADEEEAHDGQREAAVGPDQSEAAG